MLPRHPSIFPRMLRAGRQNGRSSLASENSGLLYQGSYEVHIHLSRRIGLPALCIECTAQPIAESSTVDIHPLSNGPIGTNSLRKPAIWTPQRQESDGWKMEPVRLKCFGESKMNVIMSLSKETLKSAIFFTPVSRVVESECEAPGS